jgi:AbiV family abortive infection protein
VRPTITNAGRLIRCAHALADIEQYGPAISLLTLSIEESVKARLLYDWKRFSGIASPEEQRRVLYTHPPRHPLAVLDSMSESLRFSIALRVLDTEAWNPSKIPRKAIDKIFSRYPDALPISWGEKAEAQKQRGLYVDFDGKRWRHPGDMSRTAYYRLGLRAEAILEAACKEVGVQVPPVVRLWRD